MSSPAQDSNTGLLSRSRTPSHDRNCDDVVVINKYSTFKRKMLVVFKEFIIMVFMALVYAAITSESPPKVSKSPAAYPFFPRGSLVTDWYRGQVTEAIEDARTADVAFVMFYAPWNAESQAARKELEMAAELLGDVVNFAAINCWQPLSECRRQYSKVYKWPVLIAYPTHGRGIQYNGPLEALHMVAFLKNVCRPLIRAKRVQDLLAKRDNVVLAHINVLPGSRQYGVFYSTALQFLERDPLRDVIFAVKTQKKVEPVKLELYNWNSTIIYEGDWAVENLLQWLVKNLKYLTKWVEPTGVKSVNLATFIQRNPTLILFTPRNPIFEQIDSFNMLRIIAYDYYNCKNSSNFHLRQFLIEAERVNNYNRYLERKQNCHKHKIVTHSPNLWTNATICQICAQRQGLQDPDCEEFVQAENHSDVVFERGFSNYFNITGMACHTNLTLNFIAMDSLKFYHFAERLGVDHTNTAVIIDEKADTHYILEKGIHPEHLQRFITNFTALNLARSLNSGSLIKSKSTHSYPHFTSGNAVWIRELSSKNFLSTVQQTNKVVLVLYYSKQCAFCSGVSYIYLTLSKMLENVTNLVFSRIDGDINLLPWEYTMETYPTILYFPSHRKEESRSFPKNMLITVPNLLGFILANAEPNFKLRILWALCNKTHLVKEQTHCVRSLRVETLSVIEKTLQQWRNSSQKHHVLYKLQVLRHLHLLFAHSPHEIVTIGNYLNQLK